MHQELFWIGISPQSSKRTSSMIQPHVNYLSHGVLVSGSKDDSTPRCTFPTSSSARFAHHDRTSSADCDRADHHSHQRSGSQGRAMGSTQNRNCHGNSASFLSTRPEGIFYADCSPCTYRSDTAVPSPGNLVVQALLLLSSRPLPGARHTLPSLSLPYWIMV